MRLSMLSEYTGVLHIEVFFTFRRVARTRYLRVVHKTSVIMNAFSTEKSIEYIWSTIFYFI